MNSRNKIDMYDVLSDLSNSNVEIARARDMLYLFGEQLDSELEVLHEGQTAKVDYFMDRYRLLRSLLDAVEIQLTDTGISMTKTVQDMKLLCRNDSG